MAISVTNLGSVSTINVSPQSFTVGVGGVPAGAGVMVAVCDRTSTGVGQSVADTAGNTYTRVASSQLTTLTLASLYYADNIAALVSGNSITVTTASGGSFVGSIFYVTGLASSPFDSGSVGTANSSSTASPSVAGGTPAVANSLWVGVLASGSVPTGITQDSANGAYATPPTFVRNGSSSTRATVCGGFFVASDQLAKTYAPTYQAATAYAGLIAAFKPGGSIASGAGASAGVATASGVGASIAAGVGASAGAATASGTEAATASGVGASAGAASAVGVGLAYIPNPVGLLAISEDAISSDGLDHTGSAGASSGVATVAGVGAAIFAGAGASAGVATVSGVGRGTAAEIGSSAGVAVASGVGASIAAGVGSADGTSVVIGVAFQRFTRPPRIASPGRNGQASPGRKGTTGVGI